MKRLFILTLSALVFAACAEDVENNSYKAEYITFSVTESETTKAESPLASLPTDSYVSVSSISIPKVSTAEKLIVFEPTRNDFDEPMMMTVTTEPLPTTGAPTRGTQNTTSTLKTNNATFGVNAYPAGTLTNALLNAATATYNSTDQKFHTGVTWGNTTASTEYDFYAWYPQTLPTGCSVSGKTITYALGSLASSAMPDLLGACATSKKYEDGSPDKGTVDLTFKHLLVPVKFVLAANYDGGTIKSIKFSSIVKAATHDLSSAEHGTYGREWTSTTTGEYTTQTLSTAGSSTEVQVDGSEYFMMIPQTVASGTTITITTEKDSKTYTLEYKTTAAVTWKAGQVVTYTIGATALTSLTVNYPSAWGTLPLAQCPVQAYTASDHLGLFAVNKNTNKIVIANLDITASAGASFTFNTSSYSNYFFSDQNDYYIYYPYQSNLTTTYPTLAEGSSYTGTSDADTFFADVISGWDLPTTQTDQSDISNFKKCDLQVAKISGTSFSMAHRMGLIILNMATGSAPECITYNGNNANATLSNANVKYYSSNTSVTALNEFGGTYIPYSKSVPGSASYYIGKPGGSAITFKTSYIALNNNSETNAVPQWTMPSIVPPTEKGTCVTGTTSTPAFKNFARLYSYTGTCQTYTPILAGYKYKMECWGASGGDATYSTTVIKGGRGGYTRGWIKLESTNNIFIYVGEAGSYVSPIIGDDHGEQVSKGVTYNGGGAAQNYSCVTATGGGATDIRITEGSSWDDFTSLKSRIMVAGGGGGGNTYRIYAGGNAGDGSGGHAGGTTGGNGTIAFSTQGYTQSQVNNMTPSTGGTQTSGGNPLSGSYVGQASMDTGKFGHGGSGASGGYRQGGGSGYYGGASGGAISNLVFSGGGGSSFISGYSGCNAINYAASTSLTSITHSGSTVLTINSKSYSFAGSSPTAPAMIAGNNTMPSAVSSSSNETTGHTGNGYCRITITPYN